MRYSHEKHRKKGIDIHLNYELIAFMYNLKSKTIMDKDRVIPASELIINEDGSVFHIHLKPEQVYDNIIFVGDPGRVNMFAAMFDNIDYEVSSREFHTIGGRYKGKSVMVISHGIGPDNIEIVVTELDALVNVDFKTRKVKDQHRTLNIVRVGTSGSLQEELHIGDFVIAEKGMGFDGILNFYADRNKVCDLEFERKFCEHTGWNKLWAAPYTVDADASLVQKIGRDDMVRGYTIAAVGFYAPQGRSVRLPLADPDLNAKIESFRYDGRPITNFEMESACLQGLAKLLGHRAMTVCCIIAERRANNANTNYKPKVADLARTVLDRIIE